MVRVICFFLFLKHQLGALQLFGSSCTSIFTWETISSSTLIIGESTIRTFFLNETKEKRNKREKQRKGVKSVVITWSLRGGGSIVGIIVWYTQRVSSLKLITGSRHSLSCTTAPHERKSICEESCKNQQKNIHSARLHLHAG